MKVYHVSSAPINGGAARAGMRLHCGLCKTDGIESLWLDAGGLPEIPCAKHLGASRGSNPLLTRIRRSRWRNQVLKEFAGGKTPFSNPLGWGNPGVFRNLPAPDVWNLHWVSNFLDWEHLLPWMAERAPIVWTLHDLNPLMGVWHYVPFEEELNEDRKRIEQEAIALKRKALSRIPKDRLTFVGPSKWMVEQCRQSPVTSGFPALHIPYGLDTEVFMPRDKRIIRSMFDIPENVFVLGFVADTVNDPRKGMRQLETAIKLLAANHNTHLLTVGNGRAPDLDFPHSQIGPLQNDYVMSFFYSACDLFICPSLQDNLPNTVLESIACGTPVVGFETGGIPEMVRTQVSGTLCRPVGDSAALAKAISRMLLGSEELKHLRRIARNLAVQEFGLGIQEQRYGNLYRGQTING